MFNRSSTQFMYWSSRDDPKSPNTAIDICSPRMMHTKRRGEMGEGTVESS